MDRHVIVSLKGVIKEAIHMGSGVVRRILNLPEDRFFAGYALLFSKFGSTLSLVRGADSRMVVCPRCGYAIVQIETAGGMLISACSANQLKQLMNSMNAVNGLVLKQEKTVSI